MKGKPVRHRENSRTSGLSRQVKKPGIDRSTDRVLSSEEIRKLWPALDGPWFSKRVAAAVRLILVTAQRPGEVVSVQHEELDLDGGWWTIPAERAKNGLAHRVPLNQMAREILNSLPAVSPWVFPSPDKNRHMHRNAMTQALCRARMRETEALEVKDFSPHDLRRTAASHMASAGVERFVIGRLLNHAESGITRVYDRHSYDAEKQRAAEKWARLLSAILTGEQPKVVEISR